MRCTVWWLFLDTTLFHAAWVITSFQSQPRRRLHHRLLPYHRNKLARSEVPRSFNVRWKTPKMFLYFGPRLKRLVQSTYHLEERSSILTTDTQSEWTKQLGHTRWRYDSESSFIQWRQLLYTINFFLDVYSDQESPIDWRGALPMCSEHRSWQPTSCWRRIGSSSNCSHWRSMIYNFINTV